MPLFQQGHDYNTRQQSQRQYRYSQRQLRQLQQLEHKVGKRYTEDHDDNQSAQEVEDQNINNQPIQNNNQGILQKLIWNIGVIYTASACYDCIKQCFVRRGK